MQQASPVRSFFVIALLGAILATIAIVVRSGIFARKNPGRPINSTMREALETPQFSAEDAAILARDYSTAHRLSSGLLYVARAPGEGRTPYLGARVRFNYVGRLLNGKEFDSSARHHGPVDFRVGMSDIMPKGLDEAVMGMKKGEKRTVIVPYWQGYGIAGTKDVPARATLVYDIELTDIE